MKRFVVLSGLVVVGLCGSCERHSWEETRALHVGHAAHSSGHHAGDERSDASNAIPGKASAGDATGKEQTGERPPETRFFR
ncbi:MAG TPA: hypothetical protein VMN36_04235 [Verrucomicrobiales bacterium]|nr:hypothetical protein [Verrucomicrobiales bacterium]